MLVQRILIYQLFPSLLVLRCLEYQNLGAFGVPLSFLQHPDDFAVGYWTRKRRPSMAREEYMYWIVKTRPGSSSGKNYVLGDSSAFLEWYRYHYWRDTNINWTRTPLPLSLSARSINNITNTPTVIGKRGKLVSPPGTDTLLAILPDNAPNSTGLSILKSTAAARFRDWEVSWEIAEGCGWEPLFDRYRLDARIGDGVLSLLVVNGSDVNVLDLEI